MQLCKRRKALFSYSFMALSLARKKDGGNALITRWLKF